MSYTIIFETKIVILPDNRILHLSLQGCNNDNSGRDRHDFRGKIYTSDEWEKFIEKWEEAERFEDGFDLKIGSRYCQWADYGKHLRTMTKRAKTWDDFRKAKTFFATVFKGITFYPENGEPEFHPAYEDGDIDDIVYGIWYGKIKGSYSDETCRLSDIDEIVEKLDEYDGRYISFYVSK